MKERQAWDLKRSLALWNLFLAASWLKNGGDHQLGWKSAGEATQVFSFAGAVRTVPQLVGALGNSWVTDPKLSKKFILRSLRNRLAEDVGYQDILQTFC